MTSTTLRTVVQLGIVLLLFWLIGRYFAGHAAEATAVLQLGRWTIVLLLVLALANTALYAQSMYVILRRRLHRGMSAWEWIRIVVVSRVVNFHVTQGANVYRSVYLKRRYGFSYANYLGVVAFHTWYFTLTTLAYCWLAYVLSGSRLASQSAEILLPSALGIVGFALLPAILGRISMLEHRPTGRLGWVRERLRALRSEIRFGIGHRGILLQIALLSLVTFLITMVMIDLTFTALGREVAAKELALFTTVLTVSRYLNVVPGNLGVTEYVFGLMTDALGDTLGIGVLVSGVLRVVDYVLILVLGGAFALSMIRRGQTLAAGEDGTEAAPRRERPQRPERNSS